MCRVRQLAIVHICTIANLAIDYSGTIAKMATVQKHAVLTKTDVSPGTKKKFPTFGPDSIYWERIWGKTFCVGDGAEKVFFRSGANVRFGNTA